MEKEILEFMKQINEKLDDLSGQMNSHSQILNSHSETLNSHSEILNSHSEILKEHGLILGALLTGQEGLKAEISELKLQNAKDFGEIREQIKGIEDSVEILKEDSWKNQKDIRRVQKTLGLK